ncbi:hypothetical protein MTR67_040183 [Solanum verrucosum]|uniref:Integrase catalytic domain-containing protein n=1 Tax=Solanum verrucosum TaxID=315347 RepID=A0AAF0UJZ1_SOLVR|nr:hypothetical protein MTR67_040183 [Solanum verrucosum]
MLCLGYTLGRDKLDALSRLSMNNVAYGVDCKKELVCDVHRLAHLGVRLVDSSDELKEPVLKKSIEAFPYMEDGVLRYQGHLCVSNIDDLREKILSEAHNSQYKIHPRATKMYRDLHKVYRWNGMKKDDIAEFVAECPNCQQLKVEHQNLGDYAKFYLSEIVRLHTVSLSIISDRGTRFTSQFWKFFQESLGTRVKLSMNFHPQTDGQADRTIQTLEYMLRTCVIDFKGPELVYEAMEKVYLIRERLKKAQS